jgi:hypothetical protein
LSHRNLSRLTLRFDEAADIRRSGGHHSGKVFLLRHGDSSRWLVGANALTVAN